MEHRVGEMMVTFVIADLLLFLEFGKGVLAFVIGDVTLVQKGLDNKLGAVFVFLFLHEKLGLLAFNLQLAPMGHFLTHLLRH